ncbi:MAG: hypothetical protein ACOYIB_08655 [Desulfosporosinus sp.]
MSENPLPASNPCEPVECQSSREPLSLGISIYAPVSSVPGSTSFFFLQPLLTGRVFAAVGILIAAQIFLFFTERFLGPELTDTPAPATEQIVPGTISEATPEIPLVLALSVYGGFTNRPYGPSVFLQVPLFTFPHIRGALPVLILELLTTIFVRTVVPPETTGAKP